MHHVQFVNHRSSPPLAPWQATCRWEQVPLVNRQRLLWMLSQLVERQLSQSLVRGAEGDDESDIFGGKAIASNIGRIPL